MEAASHVVGDVYWGFESSTYDSGDAFLGIQGEFDGFVAGFFTCGGVDDGGEEEWVVGYAQADGSHGAEHGGDGSCYWIHRSLVVEVDCFFVSVRVRAGRK
jgi:hypothetical protein